ncbi:MAG: glycosyltransferase family 2 protein [Candidatus Levybacteria bacterium]|nr:glycosyltransferase family 2 protein [Candidatus Levybacteria bacterium]
MKISVIIPVYNEEKYIGKCLESIANQIEKPDEVIVVDNNCTDRTVEIAQKFGVGVKIVKEKKQGMIFARNAGFNNAKYEIIARIDADSILPLDWIVKIKEHFKDSNLGALSGPAAYFSWPVFYQMSQVVTFLFFSTVGLLFGHQMLAGPNMTLRKSLWEKVKNNVCINDKNVHEDIDISIHLAKITKIKYDWNFGMLTRRGRWQKIVTEYLARLIKMLASHRFYPAKRS